MRLYDVCLVFGPMALLLSGSGLFVLGSRLETRHRMFYSYIFIFLLLVLASTIVVGLRLDAATVYPPALLFNYALVDDFAVRLALRADWFSYVFALPLVILLILVTFYLVLRQPLAERDDKIVTGRLFGLLLMAGGAGLATLYSADLVMLYFWQEVLGLVIYLLTGPGLRGADAQPASYRAWGVNWFAGLLILAPFLTIISRSGGHSFYTDISPATIDTLLFGLVTLGAIFKAAQFPFSSWFGGQSGLPPAVWGWLGGAVLGGLAVYVPGRLQLIGAGGGLNLWADLRWPLLVIGALTLLTSGWLGVREPGLVKKTAWLIMAQLGFVTLGLGTGDLAMVALQLVSLAIAGPALFICADLMTIEAAPPPPNPGGKGLPVPVARPAYFRPILSVLYIIAAIGVTGLPLSPAYPVHWQILSELLAAGSRLDLFCMVCIIFGIALAVAIIGQSMAQFLNAARRTVEAPNLRSYWSLTGPGLLCLLLLLVGCWPGLLNFWVNHFVTGLVPASQTSPVLSNALFGPGGWFALLLLLGGLLAGLAFVRLKHGLAVTAFQGGLFFGSQNERETAERTWQELRGTQTRSLTVNTAAPKGFEDEFFQTGFRAQIPVQPTIEPRLPAAEFLGPLNSRLLALYQLLDSGFVGNLFGRIGLGALARLRFAFDWLTERFYAALAAFLLIILIILLTR